MPNSAGASLDRSGLAGDGFRGADARRHRDAPLLQHDMASVYCDIAVTGIGRLSYGIEAAADIRLSLPLAVVAGRLGGALQIRPRPGRHGASGVDNSAVDLRAVSRMGGCETGGAPQLTATAELAWFGSRGWGCRASADMPGGAMSSRWPWCRTDHRRAGRHHAQAFEAFTRQERLADAFTLDASLFKSFCFDRSRPTALTQEPLTLKTSGNL